MVDRPDDLTMFNLVYLEISGACNARCPLCPTGRNKSGKDNFIAPDIFARAIEYMLAKEMIGPGSCIGLYNWGEPMLHPQFREIIQYMSTTGIQFGLSTNASILQLFDGPDVLRNLRPIKFSMCGFSQASYDRIQGLSFEIARDNIARMMANYRECGFHREAYILFHVYQFNLDEIDAARDFAEQCEISFIPYYANFNNCVMTINYLTGGMPGDLRQRANEDLVLSHVPGLLVRMPDDYNMCPEHNRLIIDERLNVKTCCACPPHDSRYYLGCLLDMSYEEIQAMRMQPICKECLSTGAAYWLYEGKRECPVTE